MVSSTTLPFETPRLDWNRANSHDRLPLLLAVVLGYALLLPPQFNITVLGSTLPPYRIFLLASVLYVAPQFLRGRVRIGWSDILIFLAVAWICFALFMTSSALDAVTTGLAQTTDIGLAYFFARATIRDLRDLRVFLVILAPALFLIAAIMTIESVTHRHIIQPFFGSILGAPFGTPFDERLGLMRAQGPFPHPILGGIFLASFLPLYVYAGLRGWPRVLGVASGGLAFFTVSSAALLGLFASSALLAYNWLTERFVNLTWRLFFVVGAIGAFAIELGTNSGSFNLLIRFASLNSSSASYRALIWRFGSESVERHPWFGVGLGYWQRPQWMSSSIDHYWLLLAIQYGLIPPLLIGIATFAALFTLARGTKQLSLVDRRTVRGLAISLGVFALGIVSVAIWLSAQIWYFALLGIAVSIGTALQSEKSGAPLWFHPEEESPADGKEPRIGISRQPAA